MPDWPNPAQILTDVVATLIAEGLLALVALGAASLTSVFGKWSLRTRITGATVLVCLVSLVFVRLGANAYVAIGAIAVTIIAVAQYVLRDLSHVGIINSFRSTEAGIKPDKSLRLVKNSLDFLGIGANKLSKSREFVKAIDRCRESGGQMRFLLSTPNNDALARLAQRNGKDVQAYAMRVRESIREILHQANKHGPDVVQVRLYELASDFALPHFRLMFINGEACLFSHLVWSEREGMDNPQLLIRSKRVGSEAESLYSAYHKYFEDLWASPETKPITSSDDVRLSV